MDIFGEEILRTPSGFKQLPRCEHPLTLIKDAAFITMVKNGCYSYNVRPYISKDVITSRKSLRITREYIWYNFLFPDRRYKYEDMVHYPHVFRTYLKTRLDMKLDEVNNDIDVFIKNVRNSFFILIKYCLPPDLVAAAGWIADGTLNITEEQGYIIKPEYKKEIENKKVIHQ